MRKRFLLIPIVLLVIVAGSFLFIRQKTTTGAPPYGEAEDTIPDLDPYSWVRDWVRPEGPPRVGLQVGHWKAAEAPDELERLRKSTGSSGGGKSEWEVNFAIAQETKKLLEAQGITVDLLPTTIPKDYWADVFVSVHADGNLNNRTAGFKVTGPWRDLTAKSDDLVKAIETTYATTSGLEKDDNISRNMRGYYAFAWWRYDHSIHPMTTAAIIETGFLTNANDRKVIVTDPQRAAKGIAEGIINYLRSEKLLAET